MLGTCLFYHSECALFFFLIKLWKTGIMTIHHEEMSQTFLEILCVRFNCWSNSAFIYKEFH